MTAFPGAAGAATPVARHQSTAHVRFAGTSWSAVTPRHDGIIWGDGGRFGTRGDGIIWGDGVRGHGVVWGNGGRFGTHGDGIIWGN